MPSLLAQLKCQNRLLESIFAENVFELQTLFEQCRADSGDSIHSAAVYADLAALETMLTESPDLATQRGGPLRCEPIVYLCHSRLGLFDESFHSRQLAAAKRLLALGADANATAATQDADSDDGNGWSALYGTCRQPGNPELCELLLQHGADVDDGESLYHASELADLRCLKLLLDHGPSSESREWCIRRMIDHENAAGIALYLEHGANPNHLDWALFRERSIECIGVLLEHGVDVDKVCEANWLLQRVDGLTPIRIAERNGDVEMTEFLLRSGAKDNRCPSDFLIGACARADGEAAWRILRDNPRLIRSLTPNDHGNVAAVARTGNLAAVRIMLDAGFDIEAKADDMVTTGLVYAATTGDAAMTKLLLDRGADLTATHKHGANALSTAVYCAAYHRSGRGDYPDVVRMLLDAGSSPDENMLTFALDHGLREIAATLTAHG